MRLSALRSQRRGALRSPRMLAVKFARSSRVVAPAFEFSSYKPDAGLPLVVLVVVPHPEAGLVASLGSPVEPRVHAPEGIESARVGGIRVVDNSVFERECAHTGPFADERRCIRSARRRVRRWPIGRRARDIGTFPSACPQWRLAAVVVFDTSRALLLLRVGSAEVVIKVAAD